MVAGWELPILLELTEQPTNRWRDRVEIVLADVHRVIPSSL